MPKFPVPKLDRLFHLGSTKYGRRGIAITYKAETSQMLLNYKM
jgi:hypothetical protein